MNLCGQPKVFNGDFGASGHATESNAKLKNDDHAAKAHHEGDAKEDDDEKAAVPV